MPPEIPYARHSVDQADIDAVVRVLKSDRLTQGPEVEAFERDFAAAVEAPYAVSFSSGTAALHAACFAAGVGPGQEVITSALTFVASANCARYLGADVRFADIDSASWNISRETIIEAAISGEVEGGLFRAIIPVHFAGLPCDVEAIRNLIPGPVLIEDACHALGARTEHGPVGNCAHSDMCCFSLHPAKAITSGEGGMVTTKSEAYVEKLKQFRNHGFKLSDGYQRDQVALGYNYRLSDIHAALGRSQLRKLPDFIQRRQRIALRYDVELPLVTVMPFRPEHAYHLYVIRHPERDKLYEGLKERGIETQVHYMPLGMNPYYGGKAGTHPNAERYFEQALSLPIHPSLTDDEQTRVIEAVRDVL